MKKVEYYLGEAASTERLWKFVTHEGMYFSQTKKCTAT